MSFGIPVRNGLGLGLLPSTAVSSLRIGGRPALLLNFVGTTSLDSRITFTRSSTATFVGSNGLIQSAAIDAPRFDYDPVTLAPKGLLIEGQRTNLLLRSEEFNDAAWNKSDTTVTPNTSVAPDGRTTADTFADTVANASHNVNQIFASFTSGTTYTWTVFAKSGTANIVQLVCGSSAFGSNVWANFNLNTGALGSVGTSTTASITSFGNGWYRCTITGAATATASSNVSVNLTNNNAAAVRGVVYVGSGQTAIIWGAQLEAGSFATSYIPTVASQVTRSADVATMTGTNFSSWYNQNAGTMLCNFILEGQTAGGTVSDVWVVDNSGSTANATRLREGTVVAGADVTMLTGGAVQVDSNSFATPVNTRLKSAFAWSTTSSNLTANGVSLGDGGAITPPSVNQLVLTGGNKWLQQLSFYNSRLPNDTLRALTT